MVTYEFGRELRLLTPGDFQQVFAKANRFSSYHITILTNNSPSNFNRLGLAIAKKRVKLAVDRNRIKRLVREKFRLNNAKLPPIDMVVMVKSGADKLSNEELNKQLDYLWRKISRKYQQ